MKQYISRNLLIWLAWLVQIWTVCWQVKAYGTVHGDVIFPVLVIYGAIRFKQWCLKKEARRWNCRRRASRVR